MKRYLATREESSSDSESAKTSSGNQKRKRAYESSDEDKLKYSSDHDSSSEDRVQQPLKKRRTDLDKNGDLAKNLPSQSPEPSETQHTLNNKRAENEDVDQLEGSLHNKPGTLTPAKPPQTREDIKSNDNEDKQENNFYSAIPGPFKLHTVLVGQLIDHESMSLESFGNTHTFGGNNQRILAYPSRTISTWNGGWLLSFITKNNEAVFKPVPISYRVNTGCFIGSGRNMDCYEAELLLGDEVHHVVAKQKPFDHCPLSYYTSQAQSYVHAEAAIERFKTKVLGTQHFTEFQKDLVKSLRIVKCWVVQMVGTESTNLMDNNGSKFWLFEEKLSGDYVKYVGNDDFTIKVPGNQLHEMFHAFTHFDLQHNQGRSVVCDLQGVGTTLTDPAIVDLDKTFGSGNTNYSGLEIMISQHEENEWCQKLGLKPIEIWESVLKNK